MQEIVGEIFLDDVTLVAAANDEVMDAVERVSFHDVPKDRLATDFDHGFWSSGGFLAYPRSQSTREYDCFHAWASLNILYVKLIPSLRRVFVFHPKP